MFIKSHKLRLMFRILISISETTERVSHTRRLLCAECTMTVIIEAKQCLLGDDLFYLTIIIRRRHFSTARRKHVISQRVIAAKCTASLDEVVIGRPVTQATLPARESIACGSSGRALRSMVWRAPAKCSEKAAEGNQVVFDALLSRCLR